MSRHRWDKLAEHHYRCRVCGLLKKHIESRAESGAVRWTTLFTHPDGRIQAGGTPPCPGALPAPSPAAHSDRSQGEWNAYVEAGATLAERRARLAEAPEHLRDHIKNHLATVWALKDAARLRAQAKASQSWRS